MKHNYTDTQIQAAIDVAFPQGRTETTNTNTMNLPKFDIARVYKGTANKLPFEIVHWGVDRAFGEPLHDGKGCWNYYLYIHESKIENFSDFWLEPELNYSSPLSNIHWIAAVTYWKGDDIPTRRFIKIDCDYARLWDMELDYDAELVDVYADVLRTTEGLLSILKIK